MFSSPHVESTVAQKNKPSPRRLTVLDGTKRAFTSSWDFMKKLSFKDSRNSAPNPQAVQELLDILNDPSHPDSKRQPQPVPALQIPLPDANPRHRPKDLRLNTFNAILSIPPVSSLSPSTTPISPYQHSLLDYCQMLSPHFGITYEDGYAFEIVISPVNISPVSASPSSFLLPPSEYQGDSDYWECYDSSSSTASDSTFESAFDEWEYSEDMDSDDEFAERALALVFARARAQAAQSRSLSDTEVAVEVQSGSWERKRLAEDASLGPAIRLVA